MQAVEEAVSGYAITKENLEGNSINDIDISLNLDSETSIYFYADVVEDFSTLLLPNVTFSLPYESLTENLYRFKSNGIPAHKLDEAQELSFTGFDTVLASASPLAYVNAVLSSTAEAFNTDACRNAMIAIHRYYDCAKKYQEGARLDSYNLEGAKAYSGTGLGRISDDGFCYSAGNSYSTFRLTHGAAITILRYHSTDGSNEIFAFVCDDRSFIGTISEETENSFKVTRDDDSYSTITIEDSTLTTTAGITSTICTNLTETTPRDALATILRKGYDLPQ